MRDEMIFLVRGERERDNLIHGLNVTLFNGVLGSVKILMRRDREVIEYMRTHVKIILNSPILIIMTN